jgi:dihydrofolate reductase
VSTKIILIAAVAKDGAIGRANELLWHNPQDQQHFKQTTLGHAVIMGRKTWDSLPDRFRPLPGRHNVVITRQPHWQAPGAQTASSLELALKLVVNETKAYVIGGAQIYALALPWAKELELTEVDTVFDNADTFFPTWQKSNFTEIKRQPHTDQHGTPFAFVTYQR